MVKLPTKEELGPPVTAGGRGPITSAHPKAPDYTLGVVDTKISQNALLHQGEALQNLGRGFSQLSGSLERIAARDQALAKYQSKAAYDREMTEVMTGLKTDPDIATHGERYAKAEKEARERAKAPLGNDNDIAEFDAWAGIRDAERAGHLKVEQYNVQVQQDALKLYEGFQRDYAILSSPDVDGQTAKETIDRINAGIDAGVRSGRLDATQALALRKKFITDSYFERGRAVLNRDGPGAALKYLESDEALRAGLAAKESNFQPWQENKLGFVGLHQFGAPRLSDLGAYVPGEKEELKGWSKRVSNSTNSNKWSGTFNIPGHPEVKTLDDLKTNPEAQNVLWSLHSADLRDQIKERGLDKYKGQVVRGVPITEEALIGMMHIGGVQGTIDFLNGEGNPSDIFGTSIKDYGLRFGRASISAAMDPDQKYQLLSAIQKSAADAMKVGTYSEAMVAWRDPDKNWFGNDPDNKKRVSAIFEQEGIADGILAGDEQSYIRAGEIVAKTNAVPAELRLAYDAAVRSGDTKTTTKMLDFFSGLYNDAPAAVTSDLTEEQLRTLNSWRLRRKFQTPDEFVANLTEPKEPLEAKVEADIRASGVAALKSGAIDPAAKITGSDKFRSTAWWNFWGGGAPISEAHSLEAKRLWSELWPEELVKARGNEDLAVENTNAIFAKRYGVSQMSGSDTEAILPLSPEAVYGLRTPAEVEWARKQQLNDIASVVPPGVEWYLKPSEGAESADIFEYDILVKDDFGSIRPLYNSDHSHPMRWHLDLSRPYKTNTAEVERKRNNEIKKRADELAKDMMVLPPDALVGGM